MDLVQVHIVDVKAPERIVDLGHQRLAGKAHAVGPIMHLAEHLGGEHIVFALAEFLENRSGDFLAGALGVDIGGVVEVDSGIPGTAEKRARIIEPEHPGALFGNLAERHAAETQAADLESGLAKTHILHGVSFLLHFAAHL